MNILGADLSHWCLLELSLHRKRVSALCRICECSHQDRWNGVGDASIDDNSKVVLESNWANPALQVTFLFSRPRCWEFKSRSVLERVSMLRLTTCTYSVRIRLIASQPTAERYSTLEARYGTYSSYVNVRTYNSRDGFGRIIHLFWGFGISYYTVLQYLTY